MPLYSSRYTRSRQKEKKAEPVKREPEKAVQRDLKATKDEIKKEEI